MLLKDADCNRGSIAACAVDGDGAVARQFRETFFKMVQGNVNTAFDALRLIFLRRAYVQHERGFGRRLIRGKDRRRRAFAHLYQFRMRFECVYSVLKIARDVIESNTAKAHRGFLLAAGIRDEHDWFVAAKQRARPGGVLPTEADVDAAGEM